MVAAIDVQGGLEEAWVNVATFVPKLLGFFLILLVGYFIAQALAKVLDKSLERVGFDNWVERGALKATFERNKVDPSDILSKVAFWGLFLLVLQLAFGVWGPNPISDLIHGILAYLPNVLVAVIILVIAGAIAKAVTDLLTATLGAVSGGAWLARGAGIAIVVVGVFAALNQLEIAPEIVNGLFYGILAMLVGAGIIAIGVSGIDTMRTYWQRASTTLESKGGEIRQKADPEAARRKVDERLRKMEAEMGSPQPGPEMT
jgi:mechanosensitive ion channel-like protein